MTGTTDPPIIESATPYSSGLANPGPFEQLHKETRDVLVTHHFFDGFKFDFSRPLSSIFQVTHRFSLGSSNAPQSYSFGSFLALPKGFVMGEIDSSWNLNGRFNHAINDQLTIKGMTQMTGAGNSYIGEAEYNYRDFVVNFKMVNPNLLDGTGVLLVSYLQAVSNRMALGLEGMAQIATGSRAINSTLTLVGRYQGDNFITTANLTATGGVQATYYQKVSESISIGAEVEAMINGEQRESIFTTGVKFDWRSALLRTMIDSHGRVTSVLEEKIAPGFSLVLSGELDHAKSTSRFGFGLVIGQ